jgi:hypothetical protein
MEDLDVDGRIILKLVLKKNCGKLWTRLMWIKTKTGSTFVNAVMNLRVS